MRYESDALSELDTVLAWDFGEPLFGLIRMSQDEVNAIMALRDERSPRQAASWLTKAIDKSDLTDSDFWDDEEERLCFARVVTWRAWCNWRQARDNTQMGTAKRIKLLYCVLNDCGLVTG